MGGGGGGGGGQAEKKIMQGQVTEKKKKNVQRRSEQKQISAEWIALSGLQTVRAWMATWQSRLILQF